MASSDDEVLPERDAVRVDKLGGRLTDLENLLAKVSLGRSVPAVVSDIVSRTIVELRKSFFGDDATESSTLPRTRGNAWAVVRLLTQSEHGLVSYHWILHSDTGGSKAMKANLERWKKRNCYPSDLRTGDLALCGPGVPSCWR